MTKLEIGSFVVAFGIVALIMFLTGANWLSILIVGFLSTLFSWLYTRFEKSRHYTPKNRTLLHSAAILFFLLNALVQFMTGDYVVGIIALGIAGFSGWKIYSLSSSSKPVL